MAAIIEIPTGQRSASPTFGAMPRRLEGAPTGPGATRLVRAPERRRHSKRIWSRVALYALVVLCVLGAAGMIRAGVGGADDVVSSRGAPRALPESFHIVGPGDTLWSIAADLDPAGSPAELLGNLRALNGGLVEVELGDVVVLPAGPG